MTTLSDAQVIGYAKGAGFNGTNAVIACAIAHAESGCRTDAHNASNKNDTQDYGLMQINSSHAQLLASGDWQNPADNMRMAYSVYQSQGWHAWSTYNSGAYLPFVGPAFAASNAPALSAATKTTAPPNAPYPPGTLKAPLTPQQKIAVLAYLRPVMDKPGEDPPWSTFITYSDGGIINEYNHVASAGQVETGDPGFVTPGIGPLPGPDLSGIAAFVKFITSGSTYIRAAEFLAGLALLFIGIFGMQRITSAVKSVGKTATKAAVLA